MSFDLEKQDYSKAAESGYTFDLKLPTGVNSGAKLTIIGDKSPTVKTYVRKKFAEYQMRQKMLKRKNQDDDIDLDEAEATLVESALVRLIGWEGITEAGKPVAFSKEKATELLTKHDWIRDQILAEAADLTNFQPK